MRKITNIVFVYVLFSNKVKLLRMHVKQPHSTCGYHFDHKFATISYYFTEAFLGEITTSFVVEGLIFGYCIYT